MPGSVDTKGTTMRRILIVGGCMVTIAALLACVPPTGTVGKATAPSGTSPTVIEASPTKPGDQIDVAINDGTATLDITSQTGIGGAAVNVVSGPYPTAVVFQLHLKGLEQFRLTYGTITIDVAVTSDGSNQARQSLIQGGAEQPLTPESPYWMPVKVTTVPGGTDKAGLSAKTYLLSAPPDFIQTQPQRFAINWIDFFR